MSDKANVVTVNEPTSKRTKMVDAGAPSADGRPVPPSVVARNDQPSNVAVVAQHYNSVVQV